ncbi:hypothetical protein D3C76_1718890 [compost metagenome]
MGAGADQFDAQFCFEPGDLPADRRGGDAQGFGGGAHGAFVVAQVQVTQAVILQFDRADRHDLDLGGPTPGAGGGLD